MHTSDFIGLGVIVLLIIGVLVLISQVSKAYDVKTEEEFQERKQMGARTAGLMGLQQILDPQAKKSVEKAGTYPLPRSLNHGVNVYA